MTWADGTEYDLGGEWDRISMYDSLSDAHPASAITPQTPLDELARARRRARASRSRPPATHGKLVEELWEHFVKGGLVAADLRAWTSRSTRSPLVREHRSIAGVVEKWDLYVRGFELATGYSELVDPVDPARALRRAGEARRRAATPRRCASTRSSCAPSSTACRPSGGMGMGIDRLLMALTGLGIRETILFPLVK